MPRAIRSVVILGANGAMGSGSGAVFALAGIPTTFLARSLERAEAGRARAIKLAKGKLSPDEIRVGTYAEIGKVQCDLILEAVTEDFRIKREVFEALDRVREPDTIVATVSSGLSIASLCAERSPGFAANFVGIHLFNPPTAIVGCELIPHANTDPAVIALVREFLRSVGREVIETRDTPAFAGNRLGFKVLNEVAQYAEEHGVAFMDQLLGPHTGRALPPLATIDLVGWDVHAAIVDNLYRATHDAAHACFELPEYMRRGIERGHLGRKTPDQGGFFRIERTGHNGATKMWELVPESGIYRTLSPPPLPPVVEAMRLALEAGFPDSAIDVLCVADGPEAELLRRIVLGYISYGLGLVGEVVERARDIDRIMTFGFSWAPPGMLVDAIGPRRTIELLEQDHLPVPAALVEAAGHQRPMFTEPIDHARFFRVAA
jgi:3-hydroxyacyl-CoA dehydrogenase